MADALPYQLRNVEGQERAIGAVRAAIVAGRIPNAWLFAGPRGVGKFTAAMATAAAVNCATAGGGGDEGGGLFGAAAPAAAPAKKADDACGRCASCRKIAAGNHPDVRVVRTPLDKRLIPIEAVREAIGEMQFRPYEGKRRVVIVDGAEALTPQASNALLKTLEEPPEHSGWILVVDSPSRLLPTIISRCRIVRFGALAADVAARVIARETKDLDPGEATAIARLLGGSVGRALGDEAAFFARAPRAQVIDDALAAIRSGGAKLLDVAESWDKREKSEELPLALALEQLSLWLRDLAVWQATKDVGRLLNADLADRVMPVADRLAPDAIARAFDAVRLCLRDLTGNVNDKLAVETMMLSLRRELAA